MTCSAEWGDGDPSGHVHQCMRHGEVGQGSHVCLCGDCMTRRSYLVLQQYRQLREQNPWLPPAAKVTQATLKLYGSGDATLKLTLPVELPDPLRDRGDAE